MATKKNTTKKPQGETTAAPAKPEDAKLVERSPAKTPGTKKPEEKPKGAKAPKKAPSQPKKTSALDAAAKVLGESDKPMTCKEMIDTMAAKGYWTSPGGKTPQATLYSAILRELATKGKDARFKKTERGRFASNAG